CLGSSTTTGAAIADSNTPPPVEVDAGVRLTKAGFGADIVWNAASGSTTSDIVRGQLNGLPVGPGGADEACLANDLASTLFSDTSAPAIGTGVWYLIRGGNGGGSGPDGL